MGGEIGSYETVSTETAYRGKILDVARDVITLPDGRSAVREVVVHGGASAILPIDENGDIIFVRQYRHPAKGMVLEIPAGTLEKGEDPFVCAKRELEEETGYRSDNITFMFKMYSAVGFCTEMLHIYLAKNLQAGTQNLDPDEFVTLERYSVSRAVDMISTGEIEDGKTIAAVLAYAGNFNK